MFKTKTIEFFFLTGILCYEKAHVPDTDFLTAASEIGFKKYQNQQQKTLWMWE